MLSVLWALAPRLRPLQAAGGRCILVALALLAACDRAGPMDRLPRRMVWAWERPEDLRSLDPGRWGVAYLAWTFTIRGGDVVVHPRRQPLLLPAGTILMAVARIEVDPAVPGLPGPAQQDLILETILGGLRPEVAGLQVDFDARASARPFYRDLLAGLRRRMPPALPLAMTALASWAFFDDWIRDLPVAEAVPMCFDMGADGPWVRARLERGEDFRVPLAQGATGVCLQEPLPRLPGHWWEGRRRIYVFSHAPWTADRVARAAAAYP